MERSDRIVLDIKSSGSVERPTAAASFEPYERLLKMLMPSLSGVAVHDGFANLIWASEDWSVEDGAAIVRGTITNALADSDEFAGIIFPMSRGLTAYSFAIRGENIELFGVVTLVAGLTGTQKEPRPLQYVRPLVQSAIECLRRELALRIQLGSRERDLDVRERDLSLMLEMSSEKSANASDADEFDLILKTGLRHMGCALATLWVPDKKIALSVTRSGQAMSPEVLKRAQQNLLNWIQLQQRTIVINRIAKVASEVSAPYKIMACPIRHPSGRVMGVLALFNPPSAGDFDLHQQRIADLLAKRATIVIQAQYDSSTGLMTRHAFERQATGLFASAADGAHSILYLDIDRLHVINETFGMHVGDEVIVSVAACLARSLPPGALSARISGDRLAALVPNTDLEAATAVAEKVRAAAEAIVPLPGHGVFDVSVSLGVAPVSRSDKTLAHALATAEIACKAAKDRGRNRIEVFQDKDESIIQRHTDLLVVGKVRDALSEDSFRLDAQPIMPLHAGSGRPRFELLLRMVGDRGEIIPPGKFLSAAERYQLMPTVDRWVVRRACQLLGEHSAAIGEAIARFAVNLSGHSLQDDTFLDFVMETIQTSGAAPSALCFEITETATVGNLAKAQGFITTLQSIGCQFALDDFGTGVSSLSYLKDLPVNYLKIDGSFVRDAIADQRSESMVRAIAQLGKAMGMQTIAEYVETDALRVRMGELGVDFGQGYAIGRAKRLEDTLAELTQFESTQRGPALELAPEDEGSGTVVQT